MDQQGQIDHLAQFADITKAAAGRILKEVVKMIAAGVIGTGRFHLADLGVFKRAHRKERQRPNPQKPGEMVTVAAYNTVTFRPSRHLKDSVNI